ncbi:dihydroneopterin aldolase [Candidatus Poribacteria bacterium]|jgi:dihydroneopterin aldolase|nr:dihydroneopterin aldolase [Candidatus Poribacteria bacterium]MBF74136.1 dihydroneopterin aldolase [Candidatus Poribacteria bacterium]OUT68033.1 MAG: dihydroneopterin aldolase [bacterium TMED15]|tara:strand:+ start:1864 stop:2238 length:375 start_codon:yes stop_codon:yes gene_type:complete
MDKIVIDAIQFHGYHGVSVSERELGQKYEVDIKVGTTNGAFNLKTAGQKDDLKLTLDYAQVVDVVIEIGTQHSYQLFETLANKIAQSILHQFSATEVWVRVKKLSPPIEAEVNFAGVEIYRNKP